MSAPARAAGPRVLHVVSEFSAREAIGRTITETATRTAGDHHLLAARIHDGQDAFGSTHETGGSLSFFTLQRADAIRRVVDELEPDLVHVHGGPLASVAALAAPFGDRPQVHTIYAWPRLPRPAEILRVRATPSQLCRSNVVRPRVVVTTAIGTRPAVGALTRAGTRAVLSPDPSVVERLRADGRLPVTFLPSGADADVRQARFEPDGAGPTVVFAGRAEHVRGIVALVDAFAEARVHVPTARLKLLLLPTAELPAVQRHLDRRPTAGVEVVVGPVTDLRAELADAQVGAWPFAFDYTTSPPAMALAEAMSVGLPSVSTTVACVRAVATHDHDALLVTPGDRAALAAALVRLLTDQATWVRLSGAGRATIAGHHSWDHAAEVTAATYHHVLDPADTVGPHLEVHAA